MTGATLAQLASRILAARHVAISAHIRPDGDALGSVLALTLALRGLAVEVDPLLADSSRPGLYSILPGFDGLTDAASYKGRPDLFIALDTPTPERLGSSFAVLKAAPFSIAIDHHSDMQPYADLWACDPEAAAVGEVVWDLIRELGAQRSAEVALCCYVALMTDTGRFQYQNVTAKSFEAAAQMKAAGADTAGAAQTIYQEQSLSSLVLESRVVSRLCLEDEGRLASSYVTDEDFAELRITRSDTETLPDVLRKIKGVQVAVLLRQEGDNVRGSLRGKGGRNVAEAARSMGGGGHDAAAGFTCKGTLEEVSARLLPLLYANPESAGAA